MKTRYLSDQVEKDLLLKRVHFLEDTKGRDVELRYFRDTEQREVDFVVTENRKPILFVECKMGDTSTSPHLKMS